VGFLASSETGDGVGGPWSSQLLDGATLSLSFLVAAVQHSVVFWVSRPWDRYKQY